MDTYYKFVLKMCNQHVYRDKQQILFFTYICLNGDDHTNADVNADP